MSMEIGEASHGAELFDAKMMRTPIHGFLPNDWDYQTICNANTGELKITSKDTEAVLIQINMYTLRDCPETGYLTGSVCGNPIHGVYERSSGCLLYTSPSPRD